VFIKNRFLYNSTAQFPLPKREKGSVTTYFATEMLNLSILNTALFSHEYKARQYVAISLFSSD